MVHEGHFQLGPAMVLGGRGGETLNIGTCDMLLLALVDETFEVVTAVTVFVAWMGAENEQKII